MSKKAAITNFIIVVSITILVNIIAQQFFFRIDLTEEKRYSMNDATKAMLEKVDDKVVVEVYLEGDYKAGFKRLQKATKETLDEFRVYAGDNVEYIFTDPNYFPDNKSRNQFHRTLAEKGLQPTNVVEMEDGQKMEKIVFPWALVRYGMNEVPVLLLSGDQSNGDPEEQLNASVENLEYALANGIRKATQSDKKKKIAIIEGHKELDMFQTRDMEVSLSEYYEVERVNLPAKVDLEGYDLIIVAKPDTSVGKYDLYKIDQHIVKGGKAIFLVDAMMVSLDSIGPQGTYAFPNELDLRDMLFQYGLRINNDLIQDFYSALIPLNVGYLGDKPQLQLMPWRFYPVVNNFSEHPISKSLGPVVTHFVSTIDTVKAVGITKTPLLFTSKNSRIFPAPVRLNFNDARLDLDPGIFKDGPLPIGYLLEGSFVSMFKNRSLTDETKEKFKYKEKDKPSKVVVFSDGDLVQNDVSKKRDRVRPLGYDQYTGITFANRDLIMNTVDYLIDDSGLMQARTKKIELRPLDKARVKAEREKWQLINLLIPNAIVILFGLFWMYIRKKKYTGFA